MLKEALQTFIQNASIVVIKYYALFCIIALVLARIFHTDCLLYGMVVTSF